MDFGLVVLIWLVQMVIYPSFLHFHVKDLVDWHQKYTTQIGIIVGPLMVIQVAVAIYLIATQEATLLRSIGLVLIGFIWLVTFTMFVPKHRAISRGEVSRHLLTQLVKQNWVRVFLWTMVFAVHGMATLMV